MIIKAVRGNIILMIGPENIDAIQNAANGIGPMGRGIAGALKRAGGNDIEVQAIKVCTALDPRPGSAYFTTAGTLKLKHIIHAVTMKYPGGDTSIKNIIDAFTASLNLAEKLGIKRMGCTALGTGIGGLDPREVAEAMYPVAKKFEIEIVFVDYDEAFIDRINELIKEEA
jgi:O-acetyl-ADP-ribose deacetylase